jgi:hypothetical protein
MHPILEGFHPAAKGQNLLDDHILSLIDPALDPAKPALAGAIVGFLRWSFGGSTQERAEKNRSGQQYPHGGLAPF